MKNIKQHIICTIIICIIFIFTGLVLAAPGKSTASPKTIVLLDHDLGSKLNPVKCDMVDGEEAYLLRLRDEAGKPVIYKRIGHGGPTQARHYFDKYQIKSADGKVTVEIYMDMYCKGHIETTPIKGFTIRKPGSENPAPNPKKPTHSNKNKPKKAKNTRKKSKSTSGKMIPEKSQPLKKKTSGPKTTVSSPNDRIPGFDDVPGASSPPLQNGKKKKSQPQTPAKQSTKPNPQKPPVPGDTIPGFDDVPSKTGSSASQSLKSAKPPAGQSLNTAYLSIVPILTTPHDKVIKNSTPGQIPATVNSAVNETFKTLKKTSPVTLMVDQTNHSIRDKKSLIRKLQAIYGSSKKPKDKMMEITQSIMEPHEIDLIVTGRLTVDEKSGKYTISPVIISKPDNKLIIVKTIRFDKTMKEVQVKKGFKKKLTDAIKSECPNALSAQKTKSKTGSAKTIYVSLVPFFIDTPDHTKTMSEENSLSKLVDQQVIKAAQKKQRRNKALIINAPRHTIHSTRTSIRELNSILTQPRLKKSEKVETIINDMMIPNAVDYIFTVLIDDKQSNIIQVQPYVISRQEKKLFSMNLVFQKDELVCSNEKSKEKTLCKDAIDSIQSAFKMLLEQSVK